ncbi:MAG: hypothetical protein OSJ58_07745 [Dysosmobacter sp.]|nr:hypothetical protein [Dysosmobacter sp.]
MTQHEVLTQEIEGLNSSRFERLCYILLDALSGKKLIHKGTDTRGQPRRSTVDSYSSDGLIVGECSVDKQYFSDLKKPTKDIDHALKEHPQAKKIYLLSGTRIKPSEGKNMTALCYKEQARFQGNILWYDAEGISDYILKDLLPKTELVRKLSKFLPSLDDIYRSSPNTVVLPELPKNYRVSPETIETAYRLLKSKRVLLLTGISGIGKSALAVKLADRLLSEEGLDTAYFIDSAMQIRTCRDLSAADCDLGGQKINLLGTLRTRRSLVILDDLRHDIGQILQQLQQDAGDSSYAIVTSQLSSDHAGQAGLEYPVPFLEDETLIGDVVNWKLPGEKRCGPEQIHLIAQRTRGYPLVLNCIRTSLLFGRLKPDDLESFLEDIAETEVEGEKELMFRLLNGHLEAIGRGLRTIRWLNSQYISEPLLEKIASKTAVASLRKRSLIQSTAGVIKIHDVIYQCMRELSMENATDRQNEQCRQGFYKFFQEEREKKSADYFKALHLHEKKIAALARGCRKPGEEWYFYLHSLPSDSAEPLPAFMEERLAVWPEGTHGKYAAGSILEYIDNRLRRMDYTDPARESYIRESVKMLSSKLPLLEPSKDVYYSVVHHIGKLLVMAGDQDNAMRCFQHIIESVPERHETRLQIARIYKREKRIDLALPEYRRLLDTYLSGDGISMSVVLAAYEDIYSMKMEKTAEKYYLLDQFPMLQKAVASMAVESFDQPYKVLSKVMKFYTYDYPEKAVQLMRSVPIPSTRTIRQDNCFAVAQMYKEMGKAIMWARAEEIPDLGLGHDRFYFAAAEEFYCATPPRVLNQEYGNTQRAENLLLLGRFQEAADVLKQLDERKSSVSSFWHYRMGQALAHGDTESLRRAAAYFQHAIDLEVVRDKNSRFLAAFYHEKANAMIQLGDSSAKDCFEQALAHCGNGREKFRRQLQEELEQYQQGKF